MAKSTVKSKSTRGGKRAGAGRKPSTIKGLARKLPSDSAKLLLAEIKANQLWVKLARCNDKRIVFETLRYLTDRAHGKPTIRTEPALGGMYAQMSLVEKELYASEGILPEWFKAATGLEDANDLE